MNKQMEEDSARPISELTICGGSIQLRCVENNHLIKHIFLSSLFNKLKIFIILSLKDSAQIYEKKLYILDFKLVNGNYFNWKEYIQQEKIKDFICSTIASSFNLLFLPLIKFYLRKLPNNADALHTYIHQFLMEHNFSKLFHSKFSQFNICQTLKLESIEIHYRLRQLSCILIKCFFLLKKTSRFQPTKGKNND